MTLSLKKNSRQIQPFPGVKRTLQQSKWRFNIQFHNFPCFPKHMSLARVIQEVHEIVLLNEWYIVDLPVSSLMRKFKWANLWRSWVGKMRRQGRGYAVQTPFFWWDHRDREPWFTGGHLGWMYETKMAARITERSILTILRKGAATRHTTPCFNLFMHMWKKCLHNANAAFDIFNNYSSSLNE